MRATRPPPPRGRGAGSAAVVSTARRRLIQSCPRRRRSRRQRRCARQVVLARIESERWIGVRHQEDVRRDPHHPAVEADDEVEEPAGIPRREQERDCCEEHEDTDEPAAVPPVPAVVLSLAGRGAGAADEDPDQDVLGDCEQPPLHEHEPPREPLRVCDGEGRRVVGLLVEREGRVAVGAQRPVRVVRDAPRPAQHADVEIEDAPRIATGEQNREEGDDREDGEGDPEEEQHDEVRNREQPLHEPEPAAQLRIEAAFESKREGRAVFHRRSFRSMQGGHSCTVGRLRACTTCSVSRRRSPALSPSCSGSTAASTRRARPCAAGRSRASPRRIRPRG